MTTPVEELRSAAVLLRQWAEAATKGPWRREFPAGPSTQIASDSGTVVVPGVAARWRWPRAEDADYISTMDPLVGLALADWLDRTIADFEWPGLAVSGEWLYEEAPDADLGRLREDWTAAWRLARLILGGAS